jgi:hypothetical protein
VTVAEPIQIRKLSSDLGWKAGVGVAAVILVGGLILVFGGTVRRPGRH